MVMCFRCVDPQPQGRLVTNWIRKLKTCDSSLVVQWILRWIDVSLMHQLYNYSYICILKYASLFFALVCSCVFKANRVFASYCLQVWSVSSCGLFLAPPIPTFVPSSLSTFAHPSNLHLSVLGGPRVVAQISEQPKLPPSYGPTVPNKVSDITKTERFEILKWTSPSSSWGTKN